MTRRDDGFRRGLGRRRDEGFSLVELMVVITILGLLASIVGTAVFNKLKQARVTTAQEQMRQFEQGIKFYKMNKRRLPDSLSELLDAGELDGDEVPRDPWDNEYVYEKIGRNEYELRCLGADGVEGGEGEDADFGPHDRPGEENE